MRAHEVVIRDVERDRSGFQTFSRTVGEARRLPADDVSQAGQDSGFDPDLALEVVLIHGGVDKLQLYARFGVPEVWIWKAGGHYDSRERSELLPAINLALLASFMQRPASTETLAAFEQAIR